MNLVSFRIPYFYLSYLMFPEYGLSLETKNSKFQTQRPFVLFLYTIINILFAKVNRIKIEAANFFDQTKEFSAVLEPFFVFDISFVNFFESISSINVLEI